VDGTLIEAWAGQKSFQKKDGGGDYLGHDMIVDALATQADGIAERDAARIHASSEVAQPATAWTARAAELGRRQRL